MGMKETIYTLWFLLGMEVTYKISFQFAQWLWCLVMLKTNQAVSGAAKWLNAAGW